jgi:hypothetical protein
MSAHYPPAIVDVLKYIEVAGTSGEKLLVLLDEHGERVTLRLRAIGACRLLKKLKAGAAQES